MKEFYGAWRGMELLNESGNATHEKGTRRNQRWSVLSKLRLKLLISKKFKIEIAASLSLLAKTITS